VTYDGPLDERCGDCGSLVDACRCPDNIDADVPAHRQALLGAEEAAVELTDFLREARAAYLASDLNPHIIKARVAALDGKIAVLRDVKIDPDYYPWSDDA